MNGLFRFPLLVLVVMIVSFTTFAFASSRSDRSLGGEGANLVSGYTISNVHYQLAADASKLAALEFDLDAPANVVKANVSSGASFDCLNTGGYHWVCNVNSSVNISDVNQLKVIATGG